MIPAAGLRSNGGPAVWHRAGEVGRRVVCEKGPAKAVEMAAMLGAQRVGDQGPRARFPNGGEAKMTARAAPLFQP